MDKNSGNQEMVELVLKTLLCEVFKDGQVVSNKTGAAPKAVLKGWIDESV